MYIHYISHCKLCKFSRLFKNAVSAEQKVNKLSFFKMFLEKNQINRIEKSVGDLLD